MPFSASSPTISDLAIREAVRLAFQSPQAREIARQFGLVAIGAKPASLRTFVHGENGSLKVGFGKSWWVADDFLAALRGSDLSVITFPSFDSRTMDTVVVAPTLARAKLVRRCLRDVMDSSKSPARKETIEIRLGALLGYPRSGTMAYLGRNPRATRAEVRSHLTDVETWFTDGTSAASPEGLAEGVAAATRMAHAFHAWYGHLDPVELPADARSR
jgi:hypothetical protein